MPIGMASFVCPTYNGAGYLAETIESVRRQTVKDWELIVVDDASTDTTGLLMKWYQMQDPRIRYIKHPKNKGVVFARNTGNEAAQGDIILVIDHDDLCSSNRLKVTLDHFEKNPSTDIFHAGYIVTDVFAEPVERWLPIKVSREGFDKNEILFCHSTAAYPKAVATKYPYRFVEGRTDDHVALDDWLKAGLRFAMVKTPLCLQRRLPMGQMQQIRQKTGLPPNWRM